MGVTKTNLFTTEQNNLSQLARALAHPARIAIIEHLLIKNACINSDLVVELGLAQATVSQHLKELKSIGIIQGTIEGNRLNYCINPLRWQEIKHHFDALFSQLKTRSSNDCC